MGATNQWSKQQSQYLVKKLLPYILYALFPIILLRFYFYPLLISPSNNNNNNNINDNYHFAPHSISSFSSFSSLSSPSHSTGNEGGDGVVRPSLVSFEGKGSENESSVSSSIPSSEKESRNDVMSKIKGGETGIDSICDYTNGEWVKDKRDPLYNGTSCATIKEGQNCMSHGRPDKDYLYWRWKPRQCKLWRFNPESFLQILKDKHLAFVGDSMARNQLESLLCMLASVSPPNLIYSNGDDNKFRKWHFPSHNVNVSLYWSPFLVKGLEKTNEGTLNYNKLYFDSVDERWASDLDSIDMVILSIGQWYLHPALYLDGDVVLGCHFVNEVNCTETGFIDMFGKAFNTTLNALIQRKGSMGNGIDVIVTTFSPHHFEGDWDKFGACPKTKPYMETEKTLEGMDADMRKAEVEEVERVQNMLKGDNSLAKVRIATLDVTKLALLRADGHPGPYMYPFPFADGIKERVQNDCVHWCLPGPIDTWNEIMFDIMKRWHKSTMR